MKSFKTKLSPWKHVWILSYFFIYLIWFFYLESRTDLHHFSIHCKLDNYIPFCEYFVIPYLLWFLYIALVVIYLFFTNVSDYYKCCAFLFIGMTICLIIYTFFPNQQNLRPVQLPRNNIFLDMVAILYGTDTSTNVCPSIHVFNSIGVHIAILKNEQLHKKKWIVVCSTILAISICLATVFLKQHSVVDGICGVLLAILMYVLVYVIKWENNQTV